MRLVLLCLTASLALVAQMAHAATYEVNVTRKSSNVYRIDGRSIIVQTRYCYAYAYSEEALLRSNGYGGELVFIDSKDKCDIKAIYGKADPKPGKYTVRLMHEADDWYEVQGTTMYLQTSMCLSLSLGEEVLLTVGPGGYGRVIFKDGQNCMVEGVHTKMKLD